MSSDPFYKYLNSVIKGPLIERADFNIKEYNCFRINIWLSMENDLINIIEMANNTYLMKDEYSHYLFLYYLIRKNKNRFIRYISSKNNEDITKDDLLKLSKYLGYSLNETKQSLKYMSKESIKFIIDNYSDSYGEIGIGI